MTATPAVVIVEDDAELSALLASWLSALDVPVICVDRGEHALGLPLGSLAAICLDLGLPDVAGLELLARLKSIDATLPVIVMTAQREVASAVQAMKLGAFDYLTKPLDRERFAHIVLRARAHRDITQHTQTLADLSDELPYMGDSAAMQDVFRHIHQIRNSDIAACVLGESGTGKELIARAIHLSSRRRDRAFVAINCAAVPENLQESELFGHEKGAFTGATDTYHGRFEQAHGGTLFLDEVGDMHPSTQVMLLRVLQERVYRRVGGVRDLPMDARIISATNRPLDQDVRAGRFRADLFFRLVAYPIYVPPLRARRDDIPRLAQHILARASAAAGRGTMLLSPDAIDCLMAYDWPGNVRELENVMQRALLTAPDQDVCLLHLPPELRASREMGPLTRAAHGTIAPLHPSLPPLSLRQLERLAIEQALARSGGNVESAATQLGIGRATIYRRLARDTTLKRLAHPETRMVVAKANSSEGKK